MKNFLLLVLFFIYIFGSKTVLGLDASVLINAILCVSGLLVFKKGKIKVHRIFKYLFLGLLLDLILSLIWPIFMDTYDFSIIKTKINFIISIVNIYMVLSFFVVKKERANFKSVVYILLICMGVQSVIIIISLLYPDFGYFINSISKNEAIIERMRETYGGARGFGLASSSAFGLAATYAILILCLFYSHARGFIDNKVFFFLLIISFIASISAGRSAIVAYPLGFILSFLSSKKRVLTSFIFIFIVSIPFLLLLINPSILPSSLEALYNYAMEPFISYKETGSFSTTSTEGLSDMYFNLTNKQIMIGDGYYTDPFTKKYYMSTDAGYMRFALYYGVFLSLYLYLFFLVILYKLFVCSVSKLDRTFIVLACIMSFILHYKGEIIFFALGYNKVLFIMLFMIYFVNLKRRGLAS